MNESTNQPTSRAHLPLRSARFSGLFVGALAVLVVAIALGVLPRIAQRKALAVAATEVSLPRRVRVAPATAGAAQDSIALPATSSPIRTTQLYAKSSGFLRRNHVEVGDLVKAGQLLAEIDAKETDEQLALATAQLDEAKANVGIVEEAASRNRKLANVGVVSAQQADDAKASANSAVAIVKTRGAEVQRISALRAYQRIIAPFDGTVVRRNYDPGALVGSAGGGGIPLFEIADTSTLRIVVDVPQVYAQGVAVGGEAKVYLAQNPKAAENAKIVRASAVLDPVSRTRHTEIELPGGKTILPNAFVYVRLILPKPQATVVIPSAALIVRRDGMQVARIDGSKVTLVPIELSRDLGREIEVVSGVALGDRVVLNPPDELASGTEVRVVEEKKEEKDSAHP